MAIAGVFIHGHAGGHAGLVDSGFSALIYILRPLLQQIAQEICDLLNLLQTSIQFSRRQFRAGRSAEWECLVASIGLVRVMCCHWCMGPPVLRT